MDNNAEQNGQRQGPLSDTSSPVIPKSDRNAAAVLEARHKGFGSCRHFSGDTSSSQSAINSKRESIIHASVLLISSLFCSCCVLWQSFRIYVPWLHPMLELTLCTLWITLVFILGTQGDALNKKRTIEKHTPPIVAYSSALLPIIVLISLAAVQSNISLNPPVFLPLPSYLIVPIVVWLYLRVLVKSIFEPSFSFDRAKSDFHHDHTTGIVTCTFDVDIKGAIRFINRSKKKNDTSISLMNMSNDVSENEANSSFLNNNVAVTITHIAIKAVAKALSENPVLNTRRVRIPFLAIDGIYRTKGIAVVTPRLSTASTMNSDACVVLRNANSLTVEEISCEVSAEQSKEKNQFKRLNFLPWWFLLLLHKLGMLQFALRVHHQPAPVHDCSAMVITSPHSSKNANVGISVSPPSISTTKSTPIVVVIGGVHLVRTSDKSHTLMSVSVSMDCQYVDIATCRRFCEQIQNFLQVPDLCNS